VCYASDVPNYNLPAIPDEGKTDPEWVTDDMRRFCDRVFFDLTRQREEGKSGRPATTAGLCESIGLPRDQEAKWSREFGIAWREYRRERVMARFTDLVPDVWAVALACAAGEGTEGQIRGLGHMLALMKRIDPGFKEKQEIKHEISLVDALKATRKGGGP